MINGLVADFDREKGGGVIVFGGGLPLYDDSGLVGGLAVSGDTSCADHNVAWRLRHDLALDHVRSGPSPGVKDGIIYDIGATGKSKSVRNASEPRLISPSILVLALEAEFCSELAARERKIHG